MINIQKGHPTCAYDGSLGVTSQGVLEDPGELGVPVGDVGGVAPAELLDDLAQRHQALVDVAPLLEPGAPGPGLCRPLGPGQVHQVQLRDGNMLA